MMTTGSLWTEGERGAWLIAMESALWLFHRRSDEDTAPHTIRRWTFEDMEDRLAELTGRVDALSIVTDAAPPPAALTADEVRAIVREELGPTFWHPDRQSEPSEKVGELPAALTADAADETTQETAFCPKCMKQQPIRRLSPMGRPVCSVCDYRGILFQSRKVYDMSQKLHTRPPMWEEEHTNHLDSDQVLALIREGVAQAEAGQLDTEAPACQTCGEPETKNKAGVWYCAPCWGKQRSPGGRKTTDPGKKCPACGRVTTETGTAGDRACYNAMCVRHGVKLTAAEVVALRKGTWTEATAKKPTPDDAAISIAALADEDRVESARQNGRKCVSKAVLAAELPTANAATASPPIDDCPRVYPIYPPMLHWCTRCGDNVKTYIDIIGTDEVTKCKAAHHELARHPVPAKVKQAINSGSQLGAALTGAMTRDAKVMQRLGVPSDVGCDTRCGNTRATREIL
jgi:hypothetical protein